MAMDHICEKNALSCIFLGQIASLVWAITRRPWIYKWQIGAAFGDGLDVRHCRRRSRQGEVAAVKGSHDEGVVAPGLKSGYRTIAVRARPEIWICIKFAANSFQLRD